MAAYKEVSIVKIMRGLVYLVLLHLLRKCKEYGVLCDPVKCIPDFKAPEGKSEQFLIYRAAGANEEMYPEGWYLEDIEEVAQTLLSEIENEDVEGINLLVNELWKKGYEMTRSEKEAFVTVFAKEDDPLWTGIYG